MRTDWEVLRLNGTMVAHKAKLRYEHINCAREKLKNTDLSKITSFSKYALTIIYNVAEMPEAFLKETKKEKSSFNQMKKRDYNMDELLKAAKVN